jgi:hypothetical protein
MTTSSFWLDDPAALCSFLRARGWAIGTGEVLRATVLLDYLATRCQELETIGEATNWLGPLICSTPAQQLLLPALLTEYASLQSHDDVTPVPDPVPKPAELPEVGRGWTKYLTGPVGLISGIALALVVFIVISVSVSSPTETPIPLPVPTAALQFDWPDLLGGLRFAALPWIAWLLFRYWYRGRPIVLERMQGKTEPENRLSVRDDRDSVIKLFGSPNLRFPLQSLRAHRLVPSEYFDFNASARATAAAGGRLRLVRELRSKLPEYPIVIEQLSGADHVSALGRALVEREETERIVLATYTFSVDPRILRGKGRLPLGLGDLLSRHGGETIIIVSDGDVLLDPISGSAATWASEFHAWISPILLTPVPIQRWSQREHALADAGFIVLPGTPEGIRYLNQILSGALASAHAAVGGYSVASSPFFQSARFDLAWHTDDPSPSAQDRDIILDAIAAELPKAAFDLLCVAALFPQVRLDLTLHVGSKIHRPDGRPLLDEECFGALAWLPWMRLGRLPDWLRLDLVNCLSAELLDKARQLYRDWLSPRTNRELANRSRYSSGTMPIIRQVHFATLSF